MPSGREGAPARRDRGGRRASTTSCSPPRATPGPTEARAYLKGRGFGLDVAKRFRLGYAPSAQGAPLADAPASARASRAEELVTAGLATQRRPRRCATASSAA